MFVLFVTVFFVRPVFPQHTAITDIEVHTQQSERIASLDHRISNIESAHPDALIERMKNMEEKVNEQQKLIWGIVAAVIVNLLTGGVKIPLAVKRKRESD